MIGLLGKRWQGGYGWQGENGRTQNRIASQNRQENGKMATTH